MINNKTELTEKQKKQLVDLVTTIKYGNGSIADGVHWIESTISQTKQELIGELKKMKKKANKHSGHGIDDWYCIDCQSSVEIHPMETEGYNQAIRDVLDNLSHKDN